MINQRPHVFDMDTLAMSTKQSIWIHKLHLHINFMPLLCHSTWNDANTSLHVLLRKTVALLMDLELIVGQTLGYDTYTSGPAKPDILAILTNILLFSYSTYPCK